MTESILKIQQLDKQYGATPVLDQLNLDIPGGHIVGLFGPNGCGKSTLMKIIAGMLQPDRGEILFCGKPLSWADREDIAFLPDKLYLKGFETPEKLIHLHQSYFKSFDVERCRSLLTFFQFNTSTPIGNMSRGMREKLQISFIMARNAKLYLMDEPISGIDPAARDIVLDGVLRSYNPEPSLNLTSHLIHDVEPIIDYAIYMDHGRVLLAGNRDDLCRERENSLDGIFRDLYRWPTSEIPNPLAQTGFVQKR